MNKLEFLAQSTFASQNFVKNTYLLIPAASGPVLVSFTSTYCKSHTIIFGPGKGCVFPRPGRRGNGRTQQGRIFCNEVYNVVGGLKLGRCEGENSA